MTEWPSADVEAVYVPPAQAPEALTAVELRARLAAARVRGGLAAGDRELEEVLSGSVGATALADLDSVYTRGEKLELDRSHDLGTRVRAVLELGEGEDGLLMMGWREGRRVISVYLAEDRADYASRLRDALGADRVIVLPAPFSEAELKRVADLVFEQGKDLEREGVQVMMTTRR